MVHMTSHRNQCFSGYSNPIPLSIDNLISFLAIILTPVTLGQKVWLAGLPCLLFPLLLLAVLTTCMGDKFLDLTLEDVCGVVGILYSYSACGASTSYFSLLDIG